jgi:hypothetical protein
MVNGAADFICEIVKARRRDIFVAPNPVGTQAPSEAAAAGYAAPDEAWEFNGVRFYNDFAPTALNC